MSAPGRLAVAFAASLALAASAGCMSVSDDKGGGRRPGPSTPADRQDTVPEPDGGHVGPGEPPLGGAGGRPAPSGTGTPGTDGAPRASRSPSGGDPATPSARPSHGGRATPRPKPPVPEPTRSGGGVEPSATPPSATPAQPSPEPPKETPQPSPTGSAAEPSATGAPEVHAGALRMPVAEDRGPRVEPAVDDDRGARAERPVAVRV
ncbi:hypothetical protein ABT354_34480 [Streptomyces sp. NPDC000594]|uniref:hypothetical protein n=1 Tax=Streptomyces sp. NPDC000594 TaxID=3154261 RepID=UPI003319BBEA